MPALSRSEKDYMEAIYILTKRMGTVRSIDVANHMDHSKPSVTVAVQNLCAKGYLRKGGHALVLTELGRSIAENILKRHCVLTQALRELGVGEQAAARDARLIERVVSDEVIEIAAKAIRCRRRTQGAACGACPGALQ